MAFQKLNDPPPNWLVNQSVKVRDLIWEYDARARFQLMMLKWKAEKGEGPTDFIAPLPRRELALDEMYVLLAGIHDEFCAGVKKLDLWPDPMADPVKRRLFKRRDGFTYSEHQSWLAMIPYCAVCANLRAYLPQRDAARIEQALRIVEEDVKQDCAVRGKQPRCSMFEGAEAVRQTVLNDRRTYVNNDFSVHHNDNSVHNESHDNRSFHETIISIQNDFDGPNTSEGGAAGRGSPTNPPSDPPPLRRSTGFLGGMELADELGIDSSQRSAFFKKLERERKSLGDDCWIEAADLRPNSPLYLYRTDSPKILALAKKYVRPKPA